MEYLIQQKYMQMILKSHMTFNLSPIIDIVSWLIYKTFFQPFECLRFLFFNTSTVDYDINIILKENVIIWKDIRED